MIETDQQRRWWFATHPEYSSSRKERKSREHGEEEAKPRAYSPEEIDAYVAEGLKFFPTGPVAAMLKALKWGLGTIDGPTPLDFLLKGSGADQPEANSKADSTKDVEDEEATEPTWFDLLAKGIKNALDGVAPWEPLSVVTSSRRLRRAMIKDGRNIPDGWAAHHIVPENDARFAEAIEARKVLEKLGIKLDSSPNGVALPDKPAIPEHGYHPGVHTKEYYVKVLRLLRRAATKEKAIRTLEKIGKDLSEGKFLK
ncbi:MAG: AHH domain-containing protein [Desulfomonile tiedjei]|nr:AHH domain-containing protein [Desulfomonile tiedjei]